MTYTVSETDIKSYQEDGAVLLKNVISRDWLDRVAAAIERDIVEPGPFCHSYEPEDGGGRFHGNLRTWENDPEFHAYCFETDLPLIAEHLPASHLLLADLGLPALLPVYRAAGVGGRLLSQPRH